MKNLKIGLITPFPPSRDGIADYSFKLVNALEKQTSLEKVTVYSFKKDGTSRPKEQVALISYNPLDWINLYKHIKASRLDLLHLQFDVSNYMVLIFPLSLLLFCVRRNCSTKLFATFHEAYRDRELYGILSVAFYRFFYRLFDRIYVHTHLSERCLIDSFHVPARKITCIPHGTNHFPSKHQNHAELRKRYKVTTEKVILNFGYIYRSKGIEYLIDAMRLLKQDDRELPTLLIAGQVPKRKGLLKLFQRRNEKYLEALHSQVKAAHLEKHVKFIGFIPSEELYSIFTLANIVVLPYVSVDQSAVLNFAIATHTPAIATDIGGLKETLRSSGMLVPPRNSQAIADAITEVLFNQTHANKLRQAYKHLAEQLATDNVTKEMMKDYKKVLR